MNLICCLCQLNSNKCIGLKICKRSLPRFTANIIRWAVKILGLSANRQAAASLCKHNPWSLSTAVAKPLSMYIACGASCTLIAASQHSCVEPPRTACAVSLRRQRSLCRSSRPSLAATMLSLRISAKRCVLRVCVSCDFACKQCTRRQQAVVSEQCRSSRQAGGGAHVIDLFSCRAGVGQRQHLRAGKWVGVEGIFLVEIWASADSRLHLRACTF